MPPFYTWLLVHYQQNLLSERLNHKSVVKKAVHFRRKRSSFFKKIENMVYDTSEEINATHSGLTNLISNNPRLFQEELVYKVNRRKS